MEIDGKDLRIGNVLHYSEKNINIIVSGNMGNIIFFKSNDIEYYDKIKYFNPIPLTESILLQCGFEYVSEYEIFEYKSDVLKLLLRKSENNTYVVMDVDNDIIVGYLHDLQNVFYLFNNKQELPINIDTLKI